MANEQSNQELAEEVADRLRQTEKPLWEAPAPYTRIRFSKEDINKYLQGLMDRPIIRYPTVAAEEQSNQELAGEIADLLRKKIPRSVAIPLSAGILMIPNNTNLPEAEFILTVQKMCREDYQISPMSQEDLVKRLWYE